ncbi:MAG TPA: DUF3570 domain-containing protein [Opitutaceae bacterium]|nr:DUF3570 domain-containing protein [Opitutaceae bacterium]
MKTGPVDGFSFDARLRCATPCALLAGALALSLPRPSARAADSVDYIYENYREEGGRITVVEQSGLVNQDVAADGHIQISGSIDAVAGATPTGRAAPSGSDQVPLAQIYTRRKAWNGDYSEQIGNLNIDASFAESRENDYVSWGWSVNTLTDFNEKNTTLRVGVAGTDDRVEVIFAPGYLPKHTGDAIVGITQLLSTTTFVTVNVSLGQSSGYLSEPYKIVEKSVGILPGVYLDEEFGENCPNRRDREGVFASVNHAFLRLHGAAEASYRFYTDTFGIGANTLEVSWLQHVGSRLILTPSFRYYTQTAASFYCYDINKTQIMPTLVPTGAAPYYAADFRLSAEDSTSYKLKVSWNVSDWMHLEASYERYAMQGRDGVTPASAYPRAGISTAAVRFLW